MDPQLKLAQEIRNEDIDRGAIKPIVPNHAGLVASKILRGVKDTLNWPGKLPKWVPLLGGQGAGDLVMGEGPEYAEDLAYGFGKGKGSGLQRRLDPRAIDLIGTPTFGAVAGGKLLANQVRKGLASATESVSTEGRRKALKQMGGLAAGAVTAGAVPDVLKHVLPKALDEAAPVLAKEAAPTAVAATARTGAAAYADLVKDIVTKHREAYFADPETFEWARDALKRRGVPDPSDQDIAKFLENDWATVEAPRITNDANDNLKVALDEFGEADETWLRQHSNDFSHPSGKTFENSPHVNVTPSDFDVADVPDELVAKYLKDRDFSATELERMHVTGRLPEDFPQHQMSYESVVRAIDDAREAKIKLAMETPWTGGEKIPARLGELIRHFGDDFDAFLNTAKPHEDLNYYAREYIKKNYPQFRIFGD